MRNLIFCLFVLFFACEAVEKKPRIVSTAFYHWKSDRVYFSDLEKSVFQKTGTKTLFFRLFDIGLELSSDVMPSAMGVVSEKELTTTLEYLKNEKIAIVPTIFITNATFKNLNNTQIDTLASWTLQKIQSYRLDYSEIQLDCDWTPTTEKAYFYFLEALKKKTVATLSVTLRLHQISQAEKTGVPPVTKAVLMCYNVGDLDNYTTPNSILDTLILQNYLSKSNFKKYPIQNLGIALPLFSWGVLFRDGKARQLLPDFQPPNLDTTAWKKIENTLNVFELQKNGYFYGRYLYQGDEVRFEAPDTATLLRSATLLSDALPRHIDEPLQLIFYHADSSVLNRYDYETLTHLLYRFR